MDNNEQKNTKCLNLKFLCFLGFSGFTTSDPWQFFLFCNFGLLGFFTYKYPSKIIVAVALLGVAAGLIMGVLGILGVI